MANRNNYHSSQIFDFAKESYPERTSRPIYAIVFLLPFIVFYELGTIFINTDVLNNTQVRVVAFVWLQNFLQYLGFGSRLAWMMPALAVVAILTGLQLASRKQWHWSMGDILPMVIECILLAVPLIVLSLLLSSSMYRPAETDQISWETTETLTKTVASCSITETGMTGVKSESLLANIVTGIGAGIYEELVFRLILICVLMFLFQDILRFSRKNSIILSVLVSAALFSAHHHIVFLDGQFGQGCPFNWTEFSFRTIAGIYFALLFVVRGFAIAAGTHALYDIMATIVNAMFFQQ